MPKCYRRWVLREILRFLACRKPISVNFLIDIEKKERAHSDRESSFGRAEMNRAPLTTPPQRKSTTRGIYRGPRSYQLRLILSRDEKGGWRGVTIMRFCPKRRLSASVCMSERHGHSKKTKGSRCTPPPLKERRAARLASAFLQGAS